MFGSDLLGDSIPALNGLCSWLLRNSMRCLERMTFLNPHFIAENWVSQLPRVTKQVLRDADLEVTFVTPSHHCWLKIPGKGWKSAIPKVCAMVPEGGRWGGGIRLPSTLKLERTRKETQMWEYVHHRKQNSTETTD